MTAYPIFETYELDPDTGEATGIVYAWCAEHAPAGAVPDTGGLDESTVCEHPEHDHRGTL